MEDDSEMMQQEQMEYGDQMMGEDDGMEEYGDQMDQQDMMDYGEEEGMHVSKNNINSFKSNLNLTLITYL